MGDGGGVCRLRRGWAPTSIYMYIFLLLSIFSIDLADAVKRNKYWLVLYQLKSNYKLTKLKCSWQDRY